MLFDILRSKEMYDIETMPIDRVLNKKQFIEKSCKKCAPKARPDTLYNFGK